MKQIIALLLTLLFYLSTCAQVHSRDTLVVVVNTNNPVNSLTKSEVIDIFMGKYTAYPNGDQAIPLELDDEHQLKELFYQQLIGRSVASVNAYWARLKFAGRKHKTSIHHNQKAIAQLISQKNFAIGYMTADNLTSNVKVVYSFNE